MSLGLENRVTWDHFAMLSAIVLPRWLATVTILCHLSWSLSAMAIEPNGPVKIVVYTGPGGLLDTTARRFADAARRYSQATFVVENRPGAGGLVAMDSVLQAAPDGRTLLAVTKSNVAKIMLAQRSDLLDAFDWRTMLLSETECLIVRAASQIRTLEDLAKANGDATTHQVWLGPGAGGLDHVTAAKIWRELGIRARWVPYSSGNEALSALMGNQGQVYVGNPSDALDNPLLRILAISSRQRIPPFEQVPVFSELGVQRLDQQFMWRGFALPKGCPPEIVLWYDQLFQQVTADREWQSMWQSEGAQVFYRDATSFRQQIQKDAEEFASYHVELGLAPSDPTHSPRPLGERRWAICLLIYAAGTLVWAGWRAMSGWGLLPAMLPLVIQCVCLGLYWQTLDYPAAAEGVGAAALPRLWLALLILIVPWSFVADLVPSGRRRMLQPETMTDQGEPLASTDSIAMPSHSRAAPVTPLTRTTSDARASLGWFLVALIGYIVSLATLGYALATFLWLTLAARLLGFRRWPILLATSAAWIALTYIGFELMLHVRLPRGWIVEAAWESISWRH